MLRQALKFGIVGVVATLVHMLVGASLIYTGWHTLIANVAAFVIAFFISFAGHFWFSFSDQSGEFSTSLRRFAIVACSGFLVNETILAALLWAKVSSPTVALLISTIAAAIITFVVSRHWAFRA